ncbi:MAG: cupin domain-containing protein [Candidatus Sumerlaeaceae bacterium]
MKHVKSGQSRRRFDVLLSSLELQCARMTLPPGGASEDQPHNEHPGSEQWLFVISGTGEAIARRGQTYRRVELAPNSLVLIEKRELHQIRNTGRKPLVTINFYSPPAYTEDGEPKPRKGKK